MLLISACYLYKRNLSPEAINKSDYLHHGQDQRAVQGCQRQDCRPTQVWNGLQDHRQAAWWEGDNRHIAKQLGEKVTTDTLPSSLVGRWEKCDYLQMEETQTVNLPRSGAPSKISPHEVSMTNMELETLCFGGVFLLRGQDSYTASKGRWTMYRQGQCI